MSLNSPPHGPPPLAPQPPAQNRRRGNGFVAVGLAAIVIVAIVVIEVLLAVPGRDIKPSDTEQVRQVIAEMSEAWNNSDFAEFRRALCEGNRVQSRFAPNKVRQRRELSGRTETTVESVQVNGDIATASVTDVYEQEDEPLTREEDFVKESGTWKFCADSEVGPAVTAAKSQRSGVAHRQRVPCMSSVRDPHRDAVARDTWPTIREYTWSVVSTAPLMML